MLAVVVVLAGDLREVDWRGFRLPAGAVAGAAICFPFASRGVPSVEGVRYEVEDRFEPRAEAGAGDENLV